MFKEQLVVFIYPSIYMSMIIYVTLTMQYIGMGVKIVYLVFEWVSLLLSKTWAKKAVPSFPYFKVQYCPPHSGSTSSLRSNLLFCLKLKSKNKQKTGLHIGTKIKVSFLISLVWKTSTHFFPWWIKPLKNKMWARVHKKFSWFTFCFKL